MQLVKTRFAPSPTGLLHIGGARTALYSWLYALANQGNFYLRIEDTDLERSTDVAIEAILDSMKWLGLDWSGEPVFQSQRAARHKEVIASLLASGNAYKCFCSKDRLDALRDSQYEQGVKPKYDRRCLGASDNGSSDYVIRFKNPDGGSVVFEDKVRGKIEVSNSELDDLIIARSDGSPTYNLCVVVDDMDMGITDIIRGEDHINNTPRQINIYKALGYEVPRFAHVSMILGEDGAKLSKRHGAVGVMEYRDQGYLPLAVLNYLVRLGWSHKDQEIFSIEEMQSLFNLNAISKSPAAFNTSKLDWLNAHYIKTLDKEYVSEHLAWHMQQQNINTSSDISLADVIDLFAERCTNLKDMAAAARFLYEPVDSYEPKAVSKFCKPNTKDIFSAVHQKFTVCDWNEDSIKEAISSVMQEFEVGMGKVAMPLRIAVTGVGNSPDIVKIICLLNRDEVLFRVNSLLNFLADNS